MSERLVIAIDGPAGAGKSTVSRLVARDLGLGYVDTGATYRLVALEAIRSGVALDDAEQLATLASQTMQRTRLAESSRLLFDGSELSDEIRAPHVSEAASLVAAHPKVRSILVAEQRRLVPSRGAVVEGRDIGTVVWPDADLKLYLDASSEVRANRRGAQNVADAALSVEVHQRDERDATRTVSAMRPAADAVLLDTSRLSAEEVAARIIEMLKSRRRSPAYVALRVVLWVLLHTVFRLEVRGAENIPKRGGAIIAPNHRSLIDHPTVGVATTRQIWFMAKSELFRNAIAAKLLRSLNSFPVNRGRPDRASLQRCLELLEQGELVGIYPGGTRKPDSRFEDLEDGFTYIALKSGAPIVPVALSGTESVLPRGRKFPRFVKIRILIGEPFRLGEKHTGVLPRAKIREATAEAKLRLDAVMDELEPR